MSHFDDHPLTSNQFDYHETENMRDKREAMTPPENAQWQLGQRVTKTKGSCWTGCVVGFYSTHLTPIGYAVESETERGSVQIYPQSALKALD